MKLRLAKPESIARDKPLIDDIANRINDPDLYADVTKALLNRKAFLFQSVDCFCVLVPRVDYTLSWVGGSHSKSLSFSRNYEYIKETERLVRIGGGSVSMALSVRKGVGRLYKKAGYEQSTKSIAGLVYDVWTKQV